MFPLNSATFRGGDPGMEDDPLRFLFDQDGDNLETDLVLPMSPSSTSSPAEPWPQNTEVAAPFESPQISVIVRQKPRGSSGVWVAVEEGAHLRVSDKRAGKNLRLVFTSNLIDLDWKSAELMVLSKAAKNMADAAALPWTEQPEGPDSFSVAEKRDFVTGTTSNRRSVFHVSLKLFVMYRTICFRISARRKGDPTGNLYIGTSIVFITYNSGTEETKRQRTQDKSRKRPQEPQKTKNDKMLVTVDAPIGSETSLFTQSPNEGLADPAVVDADRGHGPVVEMWNRIESNLSVEGVAKAKRFVQLSDIRLKTNIEDLTDALLILSRLDGKAYHLKRPPESRPSSTVGGHKALGFIAQEVQKIEPAVVFVDPDSGYLAVAYADLVPIVLEALKSHHSRVADFSESVKTFSVEQEKALLNATKSIRATLRRLRKLARKQLQARLQPEANVALLESTKEDALSPERPPLKKPSTMSSKSRLCVIVASAAVVAIVIVAIIAGIMLSAPRRSTPASPVAPSCSPWGRSPIAANTNPSSPPLFVNWTSRNWIDNGGFETPDALDPTKAAGWTGNYSLYQYSTTKKRLQSGMFPVVDEAHLHFNAQAYAAMAYQDPATISGQTFFPPMSMTQTINVSTILETHTGFSNSSSNASGLNITGWYNWYYANESSAVIYTDRTNPMLWIHCAYYIGNASLPNITLSHEVKLNTTAGAVKTWQPFMVDVKFDSLNYPSKIIVNLRSTLQGYAFWDLVEALFY